MKRAHKTSFSASFCFKARQFRATLFAHRIRLVLNVVTHRFQAATFSRRGFGSGPTLFTHAVTMLFPAAFNSDHGCVYGLTVGHLDLSTPEVATVSFLIFIHFGQEKYCDDKCKKCQTENVKCSTASFRTTTTLNISGASTGYRKGYVGRNTVGLPGRKMEPTSPEVRRSITQRKLYLTLLGRKSCSSFRSKRPLCTLTLASTSLPTTVTKIRLQYWSTSPTKKLCTSFITDLWGPKPTRASQYQVQSLH